MLYFDISTLERRIAGVGALILWVVAALAATLRLRLTRRSKPNHALKAIPAVGASTTPGRDVGKRTAAQRPTEGKKHITEWFAGFVAAVALFPAFIATADRLGPWLPAALVVVGVLCLIPLVGMLRELGIITRLSDAWRVRRQAIIIAIAMMFLLLSSLMVLRTHISTTPDGPLVAPRLEVTEFALNPGSNHPFEITRGPSGSLWFTNGLPIGNSSNEIGQIVTVGPSLGLMREVPIPTRNSQPIGVVTGVDAFWFTEYGEGKVGRMSITGAITEFVLPTANGGPDQITLGPDEGHDLWFTERLSSKIGRITNDGQITEYPLAAGAGPDDITAGPDGALWFTEPDMDRIGRITTSGAVREFVLPAGSRPTGIVNGPDIALWFAASNGNQIGRLSPDGQIKWINLPTRDSDPVELVVGMDHTIWFTEQGVSRLAHVLPNRTVEEYTVPAPPTGIAVGADGYLWFTEPSVDRIGRLGDRIDTPIKQPPKEGLSLGEYTLNPCPHSLGAAMPAGVKGRVLPSPWVLDVTPPDQTGECEQAVDPTILIGAATMHVTFDLHGLRPKPGAASSIIINQGGKEHYISLSAYEQRNGYGRHTIDVPLAAFPGLSTSRPIAGNIQTRWTSDRPFYVEILDITVS